MTDLLERPAPYPELRDPQLATAIQRLADEPVLALDDVDLSIRSKPTFVTKFGYTVPLIHGIESRVESEYAPSLMHLRPSHPVLSLTTPSWAAHEDGHAGIFEYHMQEFGFEPLQGTEVTGRIRGASAARLLLALSSDFENITDWNVAATGELNEFMTGKVYQQFGLMARALGEAAFYRTLLRINKQEALHLDVYAAFRTWVERRMNPEGLAKRPWELGVARRIFRRGMRTVGTSDFGIEMVGASLTELVGDAPLEFGLKVQKKAREILDSPDDYSFIEFYKKALQRFAATRFIKALG